MTIPTTVERVTVSSGAPLTTPDGTPLQGRLYFTAPDLNIITEDDYIFGGTVIAELVSGEFTIDLIPQDATGIDPTGWSYTVRGEFDNAPNWTRSIQLTQAQPSVILSDIIQPAPLEPQFTEGFLPLVGGTMTGDIVLPQDPDQPLEAATKQYVDNTTVSVDGDTMTGFLTLNANPNLNLHAAPRQYVDGAQAAAENYSDTTSVAKAGDTMTGPLVFSTSGVDVDVQQSLGATLSTGIISGGRISASATVNAIDVAALTGYIVDTNTDPFNPTVTRIETGSQTVALDAGSLARSVSWFLMDGSGTVSQQSGRPTPLQLRTRLVLGVIVYDPGTQTIFIALSAANDPTQVANNWADHADALGPFKISGLRLTANGTNLSLNLSQGAIFSRGFQRYSTDTGLLTQNPNRVDVASRNAFTFRRSTRNFTGAEPQVVTINPTQYDLNGTLTAVGGGSGTATIQRVWMAANGVVGNDIVVQYGQQTYSSLSAAVSAIGASSFEIATGVETNAILVGHIAVIRTATNLSDPLQAILVTSGKFPTP